MNELRRWMSLALAALLLLSGALLPLHALADGEDALEVVAAADPEAFEAEDDDGEIFADDAEPLPEEADAFDLHGEEASTLFVEDMLPEAAAPDDVISKSASFTEIDREWTFNNGIRVNGEHTIILYDDAKLTVHGGITVPEGSTLNIMVPPNSEGTGAMEVYGDDGCAAIGGDGVDPCGIINIYGGHITATGGKHGAGIGGGNHNRRGEIHIYGGTVTATGGQNGAGIGDGSTSRGGMQIHIEGGKITARGGVNSAGIGGGFSGDCGEIFIQGGEIIATGGGEGAGIGGGYSGLNGEIIIQDGKITATGGAGGAGIGSGYNGDSREIIIQDGEIIATGGANSAGIGGGSDGSAEAIRIHGGEITAKGINEGAGIGGGSGKDGGRIYIYGGEITATTGNEGAGIGGGLNGSGGEIHIYDGKINATSGNLGAGIGGGRRGGGGMIHIYGGEITAGSKSHAAGIGGGAGADGGEVRITGGQVTAMAGLAGAGIGGGSSGKGGNVFIKNAWVKTGGGVTSGAGIGAGLSLHRATPADHGALNVEEVDVFGDNSPNPKTLQTDYANQRWRYMTIDTTPPVVAVHPRYLRLSYTGQPQALATPGEAGAGSELQYSLDGGPFSTTVPTATEAGRYLIEYRAWNGHFGTVSQAFWTVIQQAEIQPTVDAGTWTYGSAAPTPAVSGNPGGGAVTLEYKPRGADDAEYTEAAPVNAGAYTLRASVAETANYLGGTAVADFEIARAEAGLAFAQTAVTRTVGDAAFENALTNAMGARVAWSSDNGDVATVDADGRVTPVGLGEAVIAAEVDDDNFMPGRATYRLTVKAAEPDPAPAANPDPAPAANPDPAPATDPDPAPAANPDPAPATDPNPAPAADPDPAPATDPDPAPATDPDPAPATDPDPAPATDSDPAPATDSDPAPATDPDPAPATDPDPAPAADPDPALAAEPDPAPAVDHDPAPATEPDPAPAVEPDPAPAAEPDPAPATDPDPVPEAAQVLLATLVAEGESDLRLTWTAIRGADGYDVYFGKSGDRQIGLAASLSGERSTELLLTELAPRASYQAYVRAWAMEGGRKVSLANVSPVAHAFTSGGTKRYANPGAVTVKSGTMTLKLGKRAAIKATVRAIRKGSLASKVRRLRYLSDDPTVATVSAGGRVKAVGPGSCRIYVLTSNGIYEAVAVTVDASPTRIGFRRRPGLTRVGQSVDLSGLVRLTPAKAVTTLRWSVADPAVAVVDENGLLTAVAPGKTYVCVETANGRRAKLLVKIK